MSLFDLRIMDYDYHFVIFKLILLQKCVVRILRYISTACCFLQCALQSLKLHKQLNIYIDALQAFSEITKWIALIEALGIIFLNIILLILLGKRKKPSRMAFFVKHLAVAGKYILTLSLGNKVVALLFRSLVEHLFTEIVIHIAHMIHFEEPLFRYSHNNYEHNVIF